MEGLEHLQTTRLYHYNGFAITTTEKLDVDRVFVCIMKNCIKLKCKTHRKKLTEKKALMWATDWVDAR